MASGLAAVTQSASILKRGYAELDPLVAMVDTDDCTWCGLCLEACPYEAPRQIDENGKAVAFIDKTACKGCGGCVPVCPKDAIDLEGYTDAQIRAMIDGLLDGGAGGGTGMSATDARRRRHEPLPEPRGPRGHP